MPVNLNRYRGTVGTFNSRYLIRFRNSEWKKANVVPIHKKGDKQTLKNYRPVSLLPIWGKIFERLIYNEMFGFFLDKGLISANQ